MLVVIITKALGSIDCVANCDGNVDMN